MTFARTVLLLSLVAAATLVADEGTTFFRNPALSATAIVFEYGGDLWTVPRSGGQAARLTTGPGEETNPVFSPDGSMVAFSGRYDGNVDVFVVPSTGGVPRRLTWHPGPDATQGWTADGKRVLFSSGRSAAPAGYQQLFTIGLDGGAEQRLPLPIGYEGAFSPDGCAHRLRARCSGRSRCGSDTAAAGRRRSGWPIWRPRGSSECRGTTRTTTGRCGPPARSGFSQTAKVR